MAGAPIIPFERGACVFDFDGDGRPDIFLVNATGDGRAALYRNAGGGKFVDVTAKSGIEIHGHGTGCAVGDYDNDGWPDLAVSFLGRVALYRNQGDGTFRDVTASAGIKAPGMAMGMTFVDYDHDGDLDLYVTQKPWAQDFKNSGEVSNLLWRNNGNGTFTDVTAETGLGAGPQAVSAIASDINNDRAIDFIVTGRPNGPPAAFFNRREGAFEKREMWPSETPAQATGIAILDFDKDGWMDVTLTHDVAPGISLWRNEGGRKFSRVKLPDLGWERGWGIAAIDYDNDGWVDLVAVVADAVGR